MIEPASEDRDRGGLDVDELEAHPDFGFDYANGGERLDAFVLTPQGDTNARLYGKRLAGADKTPAEGEIRGDTFGTSSRFEVEEIGVGSKRIANGVAAVAETCLVRRAIGGSVVHGDHVAHCQFGRGRADQSEADERSPSSNKSDRELKK